MHRHWALSLRWKFILVLVLGALLPLGLVGLWLTGSTARSGEELLRGRLEGEMREVVRNIGARWAAHRSHLADMADLEEVQEQLRSGGEVAAAPRELEAVLAAHQDEIARVRVLDAQGGVLWDLTTETEVAPLVPVELGIHDYATGERLGTVEAGLRVGSLLLGGTEWVRVAGSVLGLFHAETGAPFLPSSIDPGAFRQSRFEWAGEPWVGVRQVLSEPPLEIVLAAPATPFEEPFAQATRTGTLALAIVALASLVLVTVVTTRITGSLKRLATAADAVSSGELERQVPEGGGAELERVARAFNAMTRNLRHTLEELSQRESLAAIGEFAATLAHEVRNPLSSIQVDLQRVEEKLEDPKVLDLVRRALRSVERLDHTVTGALRVARSGKVRRDPMDLRPVVEAALHSAEPEFRRRGVALEPVSGSPDAILVNGDPPALEQVFLNLLLNAAEAQDAGGRAGVAIRVEEGVVVVSVWDRGPGIPPDLRDKVVDPFFSTKEEGTGLGLAIAGRIVAAHGGTLDIESGGEGGTTVHVRLPLP